jgi:hypothetical protein
LTPKERELLQGMCNCYASCGDDFENTVGMVASARDRTQLDVKESLVTMAKNYASDKDYLTLRGRLPAEFPF